MPNLVKNWDVVSSCTGIRDRWSGTVTHTGCANSKRMFVSRGSVYDYDYLLKFNLDWTDMGQLVSAVLVMHTDDHTSTIVGARPHAQLGKVSVRRLTTVFNPGNNADGVWDDTDWTAPGDTTSGCVTPSVSNVPEAEVRIDITAIVDAWVPKTVQKTNGAAGAPATNHGIALRGYKDASLIWVGWSPKADNVLMRPYIEVTYRQGATSPDAPTNMVPSGEVQSLGTFEGDFTDTKATDTLAKVEVQVYSDAVTNTGQTINLNGGALVWSSGAVSTSETENTNARFTLTPSGLNIRAMTTYKWRARTTDNEGMTGPWSDLVSFSLANTNPGVPVLRPLTGSTYASLAGVMFRGEGFTDADGDALGSYQVQLSAYAQGSPNWSEPAFILWDTGRSYDQHSLSFETPYGGGALTAGTYYWRARWWDDRNGPSDWAYAQIILSADFNPEPGSQATVQIGAPPPWRIVIKAMGTNRGPGTQVAVIENAKSVGATVMYNSPGEIHWTLPVDHPQISVIEPRQTHYALEVYSGDGWREVFAGLVWDFDATETSVVFTGIDYLALFDQVLDERYDPANADKPVAQGGSKYVNMTIKDVVTEQLNYQKAVTNSPVGFITIGNICAMNEKVTIYSTMMPALQFVTGLIDSHRSGTGNKTRIKVSKTTTGTYNLTIAENPGADKDDLRMSYGELVQGYRVIPFGPAWASTNSAIGRTRDGVKVMYRHDDAPGVDQATWGRLGRADFFDGVADENDLIRRSKQAALKAGKLGNKVALGIRSGILQPLDGYDVCDSVPVAIRHGAVNTDAFGSGYWTIWGVTWETTDLGETVTSLTIMPREDTVAADPDLIPSVPISTTVEWRVGYVAPTSNVHGEWYLDASTGDVWKWGLDPAINEPYLIDGITPNPSYNPYDPRIGVEDWYLYARNQNPTFTSPDPLDPLRLVRIVGGVVMVSTDGGVTWTEMITPEGIDAGGIGHGNLPGGSNLIPDGSFEMSPFPSAVPTTYVISGTYMFGLQWSNGMAASADLWHVNPTNCKA